MNVKLRKRLIFLLLLPFCLFGSLRATASHIYGADFYYTWVSGNIYTINLAVYGDCAGSSFSLLAGATPEVQIYNGSTLVSTQNLTQVGTAVEVTPVCASQANSTACNSSTSSIPGVKRFVYTKNITLTGTSANWLFRFTGTMGSSSTAGRSNSITNINTGSATVLEAKLNNTVGANSSVNYTTIPTPFFCINKPANYNPGTVDPNLDSLGFQLVTGLNTSGTVTYVSPYTATVPLATSTGSYSFSATTGQLTFTPNLVQRSLVVSQVNEYRNGVLVGTSMREMTFVVLSTCNNNPPVGAISSPSTGVTSLTNTSILACSAQGIITFNINPVDSDGDHINIQYSGLPAGATFIITGNNGLSPTATFTWNVTNVTPGTYNFFVTFTDDGCPLSSKQTIAYSITVQGTPKMGYALISAATCTAKAVFTLTPNSSTAPYTISILNGTTIVKTIAGITTSATDSLPPGTYTFSTSSAGGCIKDTIITLVAPVVISANVSVTNVVCYGQVNGAITASGINGQSPYTYALGSGIYGTSGVFSPLAAGSYVLHVRDLNGCAKDTALSIVQPTLLVPSAIVANVSCNGGSNGSVTIGATGGTPAYTYAAGSGAYGTSGTFTGLTPGTYTFHVKDSHNCIADTIITITQPTVLTVAIATTNVLCNGGSSGTITVTAGGGTPAYTYAVGTGSYSTNNVFTSLAAGTYVVHTQDAAGCSKDTTVVITEPTKLMLGYTATLPLCNSGSDGRIIITGSGGTTPYNYSLNSSAFGPVNTFIGLSAGTYVLHIRDAKGCTKDSTINLGEPTALVFTFAVTNVLCYGGATGTVTVAASGGIAPYMYAADAGTFSTSNVLTGLIAGAHIIHLKDANGCTKDSTVNITQPAVLDLVYTVITPLCNGDTNASLNITGTGGTTPYQYALNTGAFSNSGSFGPLAAGTYTLHIKDAAGCIKDSIITISQPAKLAFSLVVTNVLCNGGATGTITVNATGGTVPYQYAIGTGTFGASNVFTGLAIGTYIIHLKDANGCTKDSTVNITQPAVLKMGYTATRPLCNGDATGTITISGTGGTTPYSYAINTGTFVSTPLFTGITAGTYALHLKDANGCTVDSNITITEPPVITVSAFVKRPRCTPLINGIVWLYAGGGTPGYTYSIGTGAYGTSSQFNNLPSGPYIFHIKDMNGCVKDTFINVQDSVFVHADYTVTNATCYNLANGSIAITPSGGDLPYTYALGGATYSTTNPITGILAGTYTLHVKDANGCVLDTPATITQPTEIVPQITSYKSPLCYGNNNGSIWVSASGGTPSYTYSNGSGAYGSSGVFNGLTAGTYTFHVKDANGCTHDTIVTLTQPTLLVYDSLIITAVKCYGDTTGTVTVYGHGGTPTYAYAHDAATYGANSLVTGLNAGSHVVHLKDANGCLKDTTIQVTQPAPLHFTVPGLTQPTCEGYKDGSITLSAFGGMPQYVYAMDPQPWKTVSLYPGLGEGTYLFHVRDSNLCTYDTSITLTGYPHIVLGTPDIASPSCYGFKNGMIALNVTGGVAPLTYHLLSPSITNNTGMFDTLRKGTYTFNITDAKGCSKDTTLNIDQPPLLTVSSEAIPNDCAGLDNGGSVRTYVDGGTQPYSYTWSSGQTTDALAGVGNGTYWVSITDANNCKDSALAIVGYDNCCKPFVPDAFTPNGDGRNDIYRVRWKGDISKLEFSVYNRFGERVFVSYQADVGWDGTYHGRPCELGVYFWTAKFICGNKGNNQVTYKGDVTLVR